MPAPVVVLLPPSEGKRPGGEGSWDPAGGRFPELAGPRHQVAAALARAMADPGRAARITGVAGARADRARTANATTVGAGTLPAAQRYSGVLWEHLDPATLPEDCWKAGFVVSALAGLVAFDDPVPDYKCPISAGLAGMGSLTAHWRRHSAGTLGRLCAGATVWDLLPGDHSRAVDLAHAGADRIIRVVPVTASGRAIGHHAKAVKGSFARHLLAADGAGDLGGLVASFSWAGWHARVEGDDVALVAG